MRTRHWLTALMSGCLALAEIGTVTAQQPVMPSNGNPDQMGMMPQAYSMGYGPMQPGYPPGANPWPAISPFAGPAYDQSIYENGFWYNKTRNAGRTYYGSIEAIFSNASVPSKALIGAPNVNPLSNDPAIRYASLQSASSGSSGGTASGSSGSSGSTSVTTSIAGITFSGATDVYTSQSTQFNQAPDGIGPIISSTSNSSSTGTTGSSTTGSTTSGTSSSGSGTGSTGSLVIFPSYDTSVLPNVLNSAGVRGTWGWDNEDGTGFVVQGFYQSEGSSNWMLSDGYLNLDINSPNFNPYHLHAWFGLPLAGADTDGTNSGAIADGAVVPYDMTVRVNFTTALYGGNAAWYFEPIYDQGLIKVRPTTGARYVRLQEGFLFDAYDSGMGYTVTSGSSSSSSGSTGSSSSTGSSTGTGTGSGSGSSSSTSGGALSPSSFQASYSIPNIIHSQLNSTSLSDMAGPEFGFRVDLGHSKRFQVWTQTKGGALANVTQRSINGYGIGNAFNITAGNTIAAMPNDPSLTQFSHSYTSTTMSPMFEQQLNAKFPIFNLIPYLRNIEFLERAQLSVGYTFLFIGNVYRPNGDINWNQTVVNVQTTTNASTGVSTQTSTVGVSPTLNSHKVEYFNNMLSLGLEWQY